MIMKKKKILQKEKRHVEIPSHSSSQISRLEIPDIHVFYVVGLVGVEFGV